MSAVLEDLCTLEQVREHVAGRALLERLIWQQAVELGWLQLGVSEAHGGLELGVAGIALLAEQLGRCLAPGNIALTLVLADVLEVAAPHAARDAYMERLLGGGCTVAVDAALASADCGLRSQRIVLGGDDAQLLLLCMRDADGDAYLGLIDLTRDNGLLSRKDAWDPTRRMSVATWGNDVHIVNLGAAALRRAQLLASVAIAGDSLGVMDAVLAHTRDFLCTREQFGVKIGTFQALKHRMADMLADLHMKRCLLEQGVESASSGRALDAMWPLLCNAEVTDSAVNAASNALQLHGGIGFTWDHYCHLFLKRARLNQALLENNYQLRTVASDLLFEALSGSETVGEIPL